jgi:two-component system response regulator YesN
VEELSAATRRKLYDTAGALSERMAHYEFENGTEEIHGFLEEIRESEAPEHIAKQLAFTVALGVQRLASRWIGNDTEERLDSIPDPFEAVEHSRDISELEARFAGAVTDTLNRVEAARAKREQDSRLDAVLGYIDAHYHELISLDDVAEFARMHPSRFSVWFKSCMGETYIEYLTRLRISAAKQLLCRSGEVYVRDVALQVGYPDARYFSQVFKRVVGTTPRAYQRAHLSLEDVES